MKQSILSFFLGASIVVSIAASSQVGLSIFKPANPKKTIVKTIFSSQETEAFIKSCIKAGYIVKDISISVTPRSNDYQALIIMEKY
jgi:hypothetical protein